MGWILRVLTALIFVVWTTAPALAACDPSGADAGDVANARAAVDSNCDCAGATNHGEYVSCAVDQINATLVNKSCRGVVKRCAARSTCGKPGFVTCCVTKGEKHKCKIKSNETACTDYGTACVGNFASCCDACAPDGMCVPPPTTTTVPPPTTTVP